MRYPNDMVAPRRKTGGLSPRARVIIISVVVALVVLALSARAIAGFYTDFLWYDSVGSTDVWRTRLLTQFGLAGAFTLVFTALCAASLLITERVASLPSTGPEDELLKRYRELFGKRRRLIRLGISLAFGLVAGVGASGQWDSWLLFRNGGSFGVKDPVHNTDVGFYVFKLPFLQYLSDWLFASLVIIAMVTAVSHYLNGGIRLQATGQRVSAQVKAHLSVLMALIALVKAGDYLLARYQLLMSDRGYVEGATYTDIRAAMPALALLMLISVLSAVLFIINIRRRGWALPIVAMSLWLLVALAAGQLYPWFIQTFQVARKESSREAPYITRNIEATRVALGLDKVVEKNFDYTKDPTDAVVNDNAATISNIRLLDPAVITQTFQRLESQLPYFQFSDIDVDRYPIGVNNAPTQVVLAARDLNPDQIPQKSWENRHLVYTHGYGAALAPANEVTDKGRPFFKVRGVPVQVDPTVTERIKLDRPEIYFGEGLDGPTEDGYAIVGTSRPEQSGDAQTTYVGKGGVGIDGFVRRAAFFLRFGDLETLTSEFLTSNSRVLYARDVRTRAERVAPFLKFDSDPYPVISGGRIKYVLDAYTSSATYPYAQQVDTSVLTANSGLYGTQLNYVRNSVKAVVDAYDGTVDLYLTDELYGAKDPIIRGYASAFPKLFKPFSEMDPTIKDHLRYPEDLFRIQTSMWGRYHIDAAADFYEQSDRWAVAQDPGRDVSAASATAGTRRERISPYYQLMRLPDATSQDFLLFRPFVPYSDDDKKQQLTSFMVGKSDLSNYGQLELYTMTKKTGADRQERNREVDGPLIVSGNILSDSVVSKQISLLDSTGSRLEFGNLLIIPIGTSLLYVRPYYVRAEGADGFPELRQVVATVGDKIVAGASLAEALKGLFPTAKIQTSEGVPEPPTTTPGGTSPTPPPADDPAALIAKAVVLFDAADAALKTGGTSSLADYQTKVSQAQDLIRQASTLLANGATFAAPSTTAPATTIPGITAPRTTLPGTTLPGTTAPSTTVPGSTASPPTTGP